MYYILYTTIIISMIFYILDAHIFKNIYQTFMLRLILYSLANL